MGFRKPQYDVEEKGLDPSTPHKNLGKDGRLLVPEVATPNTPVAKTKKPNKQKADNKKVATSEEKNEVMTPLLADKAGSEDSKTTTDKPPVSLKELEESKVSKKTVVKKPTKKRKPVVKNPSAPEKRKTVAKKTTKAKR